MRVSVLGNISDEVKQALGMRLSEKKNIAEVVKQARKEVEHMADTEIEYVKYNPVINGLLGVASEIFLKRSNIKHSISASLGRKKNIIRYSGAAHNVLAGLIGHNKIIVESNLTYIKSEILFYRINPQIYRKEPEKPNKLMKILENVNKNVYSPVLINYINIKGEIEKTKRSVGIEYIVNSILKIKITNEKQPDSKLLKAEVLFNPVDHKYSRMIISTGVHNNLTENTESRKDRIERIPKNKHRWKVDGCFYFKFVYPIWEMETAYKKPLSNLGYGSWGFFKNIKRILGLGVCLERQETGILSYLRRISIHFQGEIESTREYEIGNSRLENTDSIIGLIRCNLKRYGILSGIAVNTERNNYSSAVVRDISPVFGVSYIPSLSIIDAVTVLWPWSKIKQQEGIFHKLNSFEISLTKEY